MNNSYSDILANGFSSTSMGADLASNALNIKEMTGFSIFLKNTGGTASGSWKLQGSLNGTDWDDLSGYTGLVSGASQVLFNVPLAYYSYVRAYYTRTGGTGTLTVALLQGKRQ